MTQLDIEHTARKLEIAPEIVEMLIDIGAEHGHTVTDIHGYNNAIGIVEFDREIAHNDGGYTNYALVDPNEYLFPFNPQDAETLSNLTSEANLE